MLCRIFYRSYDYIFYNQKPRKMGCGTSEENLKTVTLPQANKNQKKELIGVGHHGRVYKVYNNNDSKYYAEKIIDNFNSSFDRKLLQQPVKKIEKLKHHNIATLHSFEYTSKQISIMMELVPKQSTMKKYIQKNGAIPQQIASNYIEQIMQGLNYLHQSSILHGDLKPSNILLTSQNNVKISDYFLAQLYDHRLIQKKPKQSSKSQVDFFRGDSLPYMAPQTIKNIQFNHYSDIWSLGCVLIEMVTAKVPWSDLADKFQDAFILISSQAVPPLPNGLSKDCLSFLQSCIAVVPTQRATLKQLMHHKFIRKHSKNSALFFEQQTSLDNIRVTLQNSDQLNRAHKKPAKTRFQSSPTQQVRPTKQRKQNSRIQNSRQNLSRKDALSLQIDHNIVKIRDALHSIDSRLQARRSRQSHYEQTKPLQENLHTVMLNNKKVSLDPQKYKIQPATTKFKTQESEWISPPREKAGNKYSVQIEKPLQVCSREDDVFSRKSPNFEDSLDTAMKYKNTRVQTEPNFSEFSDKQYFKRPLKLLKKKLKQSKEGHDFHRKLTSQTSKDPSIRIQEPYQLHPVQISVPVAQGDIHSRSQQPMEKDRYSGRLRMLTQTRDERIIDTQLARAERDRFIKQQKVLRKLRQEEKERWQQELKKGAEILKKEFKSHYFHDLKDPQQLIMSRM